MIVLRTIAIVAVLLVTTAAAMARIDWQPGANSYRGTLSEAIVSLVTAGAPEGPMMFLWSQAESGGHACSIRSIEPGEIIDLMMSGRDTVLRMVVAPDPWGDLTRETLDCTDGAGNHLLRPSVCGNWSYQWKPNLVPTWFPTDSSFGIGPLLPNEAEVSSDNGNEFPYGSSGSYLFGSYGGSIANGGPANELLTITTEENGRQRLPMGGPVLIPPIESMPISMNILETVPMNESTALSRITNGNAMVGPATVIASTAVAVETTYGNGNGNGNGNVMISPFSIATYGSPTIVASEPNIILIFLLAIILTAFLQRKRS